MDEITPDQLLLGLLSCDPKPLDNNHSANIDWTRLVELAYQHSVNALLCRALLRQEADVVPAEIREACQIHLNSCAGHNQIIADQLSKILLAFAANGISAIPFKGPLLAMKAFGDLSLRSFADLDFLVPHEQIEPALTLLNQLGYQGGHNLTPRQWQAFVGYAGQDILFGKGAPVEPHWEFAPRTLAVDIDYEALWGRSIEVQFNGHNVKSFTAEDELIILCLHGSKEKWTMLKWVADLAEFVNSHPDLAWDQVFDRSERQGMARIVRLSLAIAEQLLSLQLPERVLQWKDKDALASTWGKQIATDFFSRTADGASIYTYSAFHLKMRERLSDKFNYLFRTITQPRVQHFATLNIPDSMFFAYYPLKLLHDYFALPVWKLLKKRS